MIIRNDYVNEIKKYIDVPLVKILSGVRRCGKSTILQMIQNELLNMIMDLNILNDNGIIVFEYQSDEELDNEYNLVLLKNKKYGDKYISVYKKI